jgi:thiamine pyrophosphate-dependent acetolactate synthase large subunit-like protein
MPLLTGAQAVIATLRAHGVDTIFGIPGVHTLSLYDAMRDETGLRHILARHEQGAGFMADGYARLSGHVGVACTIADFCRVRLIHFPLHTTRRGNRHSSN